MKWGFSPCGQSASRENRLRITPPRQQGRKSPPSCWTGLLGIHWFDPIAEASECSDHSRGAPLPGLDVHGRPPFFVTDSLVQNLPNQTTLPMGNCSDRLLMSKTWYRTAIDNLEDTSFGLYCGVGRLIENAPHVTVALRRPVAVVHSRALVVAGA